MSKCLTTVLSLALVGIQTIIIAALPYLLNGWYLTSPDAGGWACGAQTLADTGQFSDGHTAHLGYNFNICWTEQTSPILQRGLASLVAYTELPAFQIIPFVLMITLGLTALTMWGIGYVLTRSLIVATGAGLATTITPIVLRAMILSPQNAIGYFLISLLLLLLVCIVQYRQYWLWLIVALLTATLLYVHTLSFGVASFTLAVWFVLCFLPNWKWRLAVGLVITITTLLAWKTGLLPITPSAMMALFKSGKFSGYDHPIYDHPAFLGYSLTALAVIGMLFFTANRTAAYWLLISWLIVPLLLGHLSLFGLTLLPDRFVAYIWLSCVPFAACGIAALRHLLTTKTWLWFICILLVWAAQLAHTVVYIQDDIYGWSARFKPHQEFITALDWLNQQSDHGTLIGIMSVINRELTFAPIWYDGPVAAYPWYNLDHRDLKLFKANSTLYKQVFSDPTSLEYLRVLAFYTIIATPNAYQALQIARDYNLAYFIMYKGSQADQIWQAAGPIEFRQVYENDLYRIYYLR